MTQFLDATSVGIAVHNADGDLIYINHAGRELLTDTHSPIPKVGKVEQLPQTFSLYRSTDHQPYPTEELPSYLALAGGKAHIDDLEVHHDDCIIPLEVIAHPIFNSQGKVEYVIATFQDITDRRNTEQTLAEARMLYQQVVEAQTDFILRSHPDTTITFANPSLCCALGCPLKDVVGLKWINFADPGDLQPTLQKITEMTPENPNFLGENRDLRADGAIGWTQWLNQGIFNPQGELVEIQSVGRDITAFKQAELALQSQKELLQLIFENMPVMAAIASQTGEVSIINQHLEKVLGWTQADYDSRNVLRESYPNPADYEATIQHIQSADPNWMESKTRAKDGQIIDTTWTQCRLTDGRTVSFGLDITEQKRLVTSLAQLNQKLEIRVAQRTEALQQQEELLREAQQVARLGSWELMLDTGEVTWSPELFQIFGYDPDQPTPTYAQQSRNFVPEDYQRLNFLVDRAIQFGEPYELDLQIIREDGSLGYIFAKGQPTLDENGQLRRLVGIAMDISDRKQAEQEVIRRRDLQEAIFNESTDALFLVNPQTGLTIDCNRRAVEIFEVDHRAELIDIDGCQLHRSPFTPEETWAMVQEVITKGIWSQEVEYATRQGNYFWGSVAIKTITVAGTEIHLVRIADISDRKQAEQEIISTAQQLETANQELKTFAYSVSHDLRAPLRAIDGFSKALIEDYGDRFDAEAKDYFDRIHRAVERMGDLIDDLLRLSRVSRAEIRYGRVNLTKLVQEIAANLQEFEPERQVEFAIAPEAIAYADNSLMQVVLENILQNAWKFTSHHLTARIEFGTMQPKIEFQIESPVETVYFIRDDGAGFDIAYAAMLFGVFQRLHNTNEFPGTGIGLATVQRIIHRHGGRVWAEGAVEMGATIYFSLPNQT